LVNSWVLAGGKTAVVETDYGRLLMTKVALFLVMLSDDTVNRRWLTPRVVEGTTQRRGRLSETLYSRPA
jgi:putative copper resistance protein D